MKHQQIHSPQLIILTSTNIRRASDSPGLKDQVGVRSDGTASTSRHRHGTAERADRTVNPWGTGEIAMSSFESRNWTADDWNIFTDWRPLHPVRCDYSIMWRHQVRAPQFTTDHGWPRTGAFLWEFWSWHPCNSRHFDSHRSPVVGLSHVESPRLPRETDVSQWQ